MTSKQAICSRSVQPDGAKVVADEKEFRKSMNFSKNHGVSSLKQFDERSGVDSETCGHIPIS